MGSFFDDDAAVDRELALIREAIELVSRGVSRRVVVAGLSFGDAGADLAALEARYAGVRLHRLRSGRGSGSDVAVEPNVGGATPHEPS